MKVNPLARLPRPALAAAKWFSITIGVVAIPVLLLSTRSAPAPSAAKRAEPVQSLPLTLAGEGGRLSLGWDREAPAIRAAQCGVLWINDGGIHRRVILDDSQLRAGKLFYWPVNKDVSFEMRMSEGSDGSGSRNRRNTVQVTGRHSIDSDQPEDVSGSGKLARIEPGDAPAFAIQGEPQLVAVPAQAVRLPEVGEKQTRSTAIRAVPQGALEPYSTVTVEAVEVTESRLGRIAGKIPLLRRLHRTPESLPPRPVRQTTPTVPAELRRTLKSEVPLDVRAYIDESGKVTYAEILSDFAEADRGLASVAVFNARRWEFRPAQLGGHVVPGQVILHYRFGNPLLAIASDRQ